MKRTRLSTTLVTIGLGIVLVVIALSLASCAPTDEPTGPIQGPPAPTATQMPIATEAPITCPPEGYLPLKDGLLTVSYEGVELATITWKNGVVTITSDTMEQSTNLNEGYALAAFILIKNGVPVATGMIEITICNGEFNYKMPVVTPIGEQTT